MKKKKPFFAQKRARIIAPVTVLALLIAVWWIAVVQTHSAIFPTPL